MLEKKIYSTILFLYFLKLAVEMYRYENITTQIYGHVALFSETVQKEQFCVGCKSFCVF